MVNGSFDEQERLAFLLGQLDRVQAMYARIVTRATALLAMNVAMVTVLAINLTREVLHSCLFWFALPATIGNVAAFAAIIATTYSHLRNHGPRSLLFFGDISMMRAADYVRDVKAAT